MNHRYASSNIPDMCACGLLRLDQIHTLIAKETEQVPDDLKDKPWAWDMYFKLRRKGDAA
jgi:hypothetical protein